MKLKYLLVTITAVILSLFPIHAEAALDGDEGETSTGTAELDLELPLLIVIRNMADLNFGTYTGTGPLTDNQDINIASNDDQATPSYQVVGTGTGPGSAFSIQRDTPASPTHELVYTVNFNDQTGLTGTTGLTAGTPLTAQTGVHAALGTMTDNANYQVTFSEAVLQAAPYGLYSGTLTLVVEPE